MPDYRLLLETSGRTRLGLADGMNILARADLGSGRQHNRELVPTLKKFLEVAHLRPSDLAGIIAGVGPGSYTGLRVGLTAAKTLAYALGCSLVAAPTFETIAFGIPGELDVIADALQGMIYVQHFRDGESTGELSIAKFEDWISKRTDCPVAGPAVPQLANRLGEFASPNNEPSLESLLRVGLKRAALNTGEVMELEPLYLRGSSAEEKAAAQINTNELGGGH